LGVPGLINAYKTAASFALQLSPAVKKPVLAFYRLQFDYTGMNDVMRILKKHNCRVAQQQIQLFCELEVGIPKTRLELCLLQLQQLRGVEIVAPR
jgi:putative IMPACT (imprinted ancient) family translation regulator